MMNGIYQMREISKKKKRDKAVYYLFHKCHSPGSRCLLNLPHWGHLQIVGDSQKAPYCEKVEMFKCLKKRGLRNARVKINLGIFNTYVFWTDSPLYIL